MLSNGATNLASALNLDEDHDDENKEIKEFYESNLHCLKNCSMNLIHYDIIRNIAVLLDNTKTFDEEWKTYATEMGLDNKTLAEIKVSAYCHRDQAIFFAMDRTVRQRGTFGDIIYALLKTKRFDVLKDIEPFVRELLPKIPQRQSINSTSTVICNNENDAQEPHTIKINPTLFREQGYELNYIQQNSINSRFKNALKISSSSKMPQETVEEIKIPSAPVEEKLTVLIQHAEAEYEIAEQLSTNFSREGVIATTLSEVNDFTLYEPTNVLETVFGEVNFIVPVLSSSFIEDIYPKNYDQYLESTYAQNNRKLFTLMLDEYKRDRCFNYRVRPVIVEGMSRRLIKEPMFSIAFRLPNEVSKLIRVLKKTKELKAQQLVQ